MAEIALQCAASWSFERASEMLERLVGVTLSSSEIHALCQEEGEVIKAFVEESSAEIVAEAKVRYNGESDDKRLYTGFDGVWVGSRESKGGMEGKVGILFEETSQNQVKVSPKRRAILSKRYVGSFLGWNTVAEQADRELWSHGWASLHTTVYGDGAGWIGSVRDEVLPESMLVLDWWHLKDKLSRCLGAVVDDEQERARVQTLVRGHLWRGDWREALTALSEHLPARTYQRKKTRELCAYITNQRSGIINYGAWHEAGRRVSTSIVEKTGDLVIVRRMKKQGMSWTRRGADNVTALRICLLNQDWEAVWANRKAA